MPKLRSTSQHTEPEFTSQNITELEFGKLLAPYIAERSFPDALSSDNSLRREAASLFGSRDVLAGLSDGKWQDKVVKLWRNAYEKNWKMFPDNLAEEVNSWIVSKYCEAPGKYTQCSSKGYLRWKNAKANRFSMSVPAMFFLILGGFELPPKMIEHQAITYAAIRDIIAVPNGLEPILVLYDPTEGNKKRKPDSLEKGVPKQRRSMPKNITGLPVIGKHDTAKLGQHDEPEDIVAGRRNDAQQKPQPRLGRLTPSSRQMKSTATMSSARQSAKMDNDDDDSSSDWSESEETERLRRGYSISSGEIVQSKFPAKQPIVKPFTSHHDEPRSGDDNQHPATFARDGKRDSALGGERIDLLKANVPKVDKMVWSPTLSETRYKLDGQSHQMDNAIDYLMDTEEVQRGVLEPSITENPHKVKQGDMHSFAAMLGHEMKRADTILRHDMDAKFRNLHARTAEGLKFLIGRRVEDLTPVHTVVFSIRDEMARAAKDLDSRVKQLEADRTSAQTELADLRQKYDTLRAEYDEAIAERDTKAADAVRTMGKDETVTEELNRSVWDAFRGSQ